MSEPITPPSPPERRASCPICGKPPQPRWRPFCSKRCADVDLGRWFGEAYRIPGTAGDADQKDPDRDAAANDGATGDER